MSKEASPQIHLKDMDARVCRKVSEVLKACKPKREEIAKHLGISQALLNAYASYSYSNRKDECKPNGQTLRVRKAKFPLFRLKLFREITGDDSLVREFALTEREKWLLEVGELFEQLLAKWGRGKK